MLELSLASGLASADARRRFFERFGRRLQSKSFPGHTDAQNTDAALRAIFAKYSIGLLLSVKHRGF